MANDWKFGLFGCFDDTKLCIISFLVPCYSIGMNAQALGDDCLIHGLLFAIGLNFGPVIRHRTRQKYDIVGSMLLDVLIYAVCPCCAIVQEARQNAWGLPKTFNDIGRTNETMERD